MESRKKAGITIVILIVIVITALLSVSCDRSEKLLEIFNVTTFKSDIVIKRVDGQEPLNMPLKYAMYILRSRSEFEDEIVSLNISSVRYMMSNTSLSMSSSEGIYAKSDSSEVKEVIDSIKYCIGITTLNGIFTDKEVSKITLYEGYTADLLEDNLQNYAIIPSTLSKHIKARLSDAKKVISIKNSTTNSFENFKIIGEYATDKEHDAIYLSFGGLSRAVAGVNMDVSDHIEYMEIDVDENKDLANFVYYINNIFADDNMLSQYSKRINRLNEPYPYMFINTVGLEPVYIEEDADFEKNVITISRIDGKENLEMSHLYSDALVKDYFDYSRYITDIVISTGRKGVNPADYPSGTNYQPYGLKLMTLGRSQDSIWMDYPLPPYHQAITSISEIKSDKKNSEIYFYGTYANKDLVVQREEDYRNRATQRGSAMEGYAIVPAPMFEAIRHYVSTDQQILELCATDESNPNNLLYVAFTAIGYYELPEDSTDQYDVIYITYVGNNNKYKKEAYKNEYIESITIETNCDADMESLTRYLRQYFAPSDVAGEYTGLKNELGLNYEYCYTIKENVD
ncbi:MAG TPA: hypothetical protein PLQ68_08115 [Clostridia bacterium]|nr:hypothetical protein [Clostridia bacterium]